jgi:hypothetical protein
MTTELFIGDKFIGKRRYYSLLRDRGRARRNSKLWYVYIKFTSDILILLALLVVAQWWSKPNQKTFFRLFGYCILYHLSIEQKENYFMD